MESRQPNPPLDMLHILELISAPPLDMLRILELISAPFFGASSAPGKFKAASGRLGYVI